MKVAVDELRNTVKQPGAPSVPVVRVLLTCTDSQIMDYLATCGSMLVPRTCW